MDWKSIIGVVAPTLATALGGPLAGLAVESIGKVMGMDQPTVEKVKEALSEGSLTAEQITQLKQAELALQVKMRELDISEQQLYANDTANARALQIATHSQWPGILSAITTLAVLGVIAARMFGTNIPEDATTVQLIGSLTTGWGLCLSYWMGSTRSSSEKNNLLARSQLVDK